MHAIQPLEYETKYISIIIYFLTSIILLKTVLGHVLWTLFQLMASCSVYLCDHCLVPSGCVSSHCIRLTSICLASRSGSTSSAQMIPNHTINKVAQPCLNPHGNIESSSRCLSSFDFTHQVAYTELILWAGGVGAGEENTRNSTPAGVTLLVKEKKKWLWGSVLQTWLHRFSSKHLIFKIQGLVVDKVKFFFIFDRNYCLCGSSWRVLKLSKVWL